MKIVCATALGVALILTACHDEAAYNQPGHAAQSLAQPGSQAAKGKAALNLSERELLDAELVDTDGTRLGDVAAMKRGHGGAVEGLLIEVADAVPTRRVYLPLDGLAPLYDGDHWTIVTSLTPEQIAALPVVAPSQSASQSKADHRAPSTAPEKHPRAPQSTQY